MHTPTSLCNLKSPSPTANLSNLHHGLKRKKERERGLFLKKKKQLTKNNWSSLKLPRSWNSPEHQCRACLKLSLFHTPPLSPAIGRRAVQKFSKQFSFYVDRGVPLRAERGWLSLGEACCYPQAKERCRRLHSLWNPIPFSTKATAVRLQLRQEQRINPGLIAGQAFHAGGRRGTGVHGFP